MICLVPSDTTPYFFGQDQLDTFNKSNRNLANQLGLPSQNTSSTSTYDIYRINPKRGENPTIFKSKVAPTTQGNIKQAGGAEQILVPQRKLFQEPVKVDKIKDRKR